MMNNRTAIYAGSFDILTHGHMHIISKGAQLFDKLFVAVGTNPNKKYIFTEEERFEMLRACCSSKETYDSGSNCDICNLYEEEAYKIEPIVMGNRYLVDFASEDEIQAHWYLRGIRNPEDYAFEKTMAEVNWDLLPRSYAQPVWIPAKPSLSTISSSLVRGLIGPKGWEWAIHKMVPHPVWNKLVERFDGEDPFSSDRIANGEEDE
jgi:pantetheine-phosphate adenylyltransferase